MYNSCRFKKKINICFWNIRGLTHHKLQSEICGSFLANFDIILLKGTWSDEIQTGGLRFIDMYRKYRHRAATRASGGIGIFIWNNINKEGVDIYRAHEDIIVWLKIKNYFFGLEKNVLLGVVYITPENSTYNTDDPYSILYNEISTISENNDTLICGDLNSRTSDMTDYIENSQSGGSEGDLATILSDNNQCYANKHSPEYLHMINSLRGYLKRLQHLINTGTTSLIFANQIGFSSWMDV